MSHDLRADGVVVRTPLLPVTTLLEWAAAPDPRAFLAELLARPDVHEAIFVASPGLHQTIAKWRTAPTSPAGRRAELALVKYVARMAARATPFGLFSGVSPGKLGRDTRIELAPRAAYQRRTRLDNDYLFLLVDELTRAPAIRERVELRPNTSIYRIAGRLRYVAARLDGKERRYHLVSVEPTAYLLATLERAARGARIAALAEALVDPEVSLDEARAYVNELVDAQLLVPELGVHVTGPEPIDGLLAQLEVAGGADTHAVLAGARAQLLALDAGGLTNPAERYRAIAAHLETLPAKVDLSRLFQVDLVKPATVTLGTRVAAQLADAITTIGQLSRGGEAASLDEFRRAFRERYEGRAVPLAEALDEESGIGFEASRHPGSEGAPLLATLAFPAGAADPRVPWRATERHLQRRLAETLAAGRDELAFDDADLAALKLATPASFPDAFSAMVRIAVTEGGDIEMLFEGTNGPSGARLLGRFCHASPEISELVRAHHAIEEAHRPDAVYAEIVHLNEGRIGNILCRPVLRAHEIVFLGVSGAPEEARIQLDDLVVAIEGERIVLRSRRLGREVIPRLSTAHNFRLRSLGIYRFLCALAMQGREVASWSWGVLGGAPFLPRVRLGRVILSRATWNVDARELAPITAAVRASAGVAEAVAALRVARKIPRMCAIVAGDNELPIDFDNPMLVAAFADDVAGAFGTELVELYPAPDRLIARGPEGGFTNEMIVTFTRARKDIPSVAAPRPAPVIRRSFTPGSEWLYAKLYCGEATGDRVLKEVIAPVVREHGGPWFFLRYQDPQPHLRVRLHGDPARLLDEALPALHRAVAPLHDSGVIRELVLGTYEREVERYGGDRGIELVEQIFWKDSEAVLAIVELLEGDAGAEARWQLALRGIDSLLDAIGLPAAARAQVATTAREMLGREMTADTVFWTAAGARFAKERAALEPVFLRDPVRDAAHDFEPGFAILAARDAAIRELAGELRRRDEAGELVPRIADFAWALVHMHANRLLHASQRAQELVLYDFLRRLHAWQTKAKPK